MECPKCGSDVPEGASFCINCGATVNGEAEKAATEAGPPEKEKPEPTEPEPGPPAEPEKPPELAASEALDELPEPDRKLEETPPETEKPPKREEKQPADKTEKPYRDYRKPITAVIFIVVIICSIFACCAFCILISSMQGYGF